MVAMVNEGPTIQVRQYRPEDHATVTKIYVEGLMEADDNPDYQYLWEERLRKDLTNDFADIADSHMASGGNFWVAIAKTDRSTELVGIIGLQRRSETVGEVRRVFVASSCQRMGVGRKLMAELESWSKKHGVENLFLTTGENNDRGKAFYAALGYARVDADEVLRAWEDPPYFEVAKFVKQL